MKTITVLAITLMLSMPAFAGEVGESGSVTTAAAMPENHTFTLNSNSMDFGELVDAGGGTYKKADGADPTFDFTVGGNSENGYYVNISQTQELQSAAGTALEGVLNIHSSVDSSPVDVSQTVRYPFDPMNGNTQTVVVHGDLTGVPAGKAAGSYTGILTVSAATRS